MKEKRFECDCHEVSHSLVVNSFEEKDRPREIYVSVLNNPLDFVEKLKACWKILTGEGYYASEIIMNEDGAKDFIDFVSQLGE